MNTTAVEESRIPATRKTPEVIFSDSGSISINGRSMITGISDFPQRMDELIDKYVDKPARQTIVDFNLEYLSTNNIRIYVSLLSKIANLRMKGLSVKINWYYDEGDFDIYEKGENISLSLKIPVNYFKKEPGEQDLVPFQESVKTPC